MKFSLIYADPPWKYNDRKLLRKDGRVPRAGIGACNHYPLMTTERIKAIPVRDITGDNALLFLWATCPLLEKALEVIEAWGFDFKTVGFTWVKTNKHNKKPCFGTGFYTKSNIELCLLAARGKTLKPATDTVSQVILSDREEHSQKPEEARVRLEKMYPDLAKVEMFAREEHPGWLCLGNEIDGLDIYEAISQVAAKEE